MDGVVGVGEFDGGVHEHAAVKLGVVEPEVHDIEHGEGVAEEGVAGDFFDKRLAQAWDSHSSRRRTAASMRSSLLSKCL